MLDGFCSDRVCRSFSAAEFCWSHWQMCSRSLQLHNCRQGLVRWEENSRTVSIVNKTKTNGSGVRVQLKPVQIKSLLDWLTSAAVLFFLWLWWCMCMCVCVHVWDRKRELQKEAGSSTFLHWWTFYYPACTYWVWVYNQCVIAPTLTEAEGGGGGWNI